MAHTANYNKNDLGRSLRAAVRGTACDGCIHRDQGGDHRNEILCLFSSTGCVLKPPKKCSNRNRPIESGDDTLPQASAAA
jgi:hypothetical protein